MDIAFITPEITPYSRATELGDVCAALPKALRGTGHRLAGGVPQPVAPDHPDYTVPRFSREHAAKYVGLPWHRQFELDQIPHGRTNALHFCFAQSDLDEFKATLKPAARGRKPRPPGRISSDRGPPAGVTRPVTPASNP